MGVTATVYAIDVTELEACRADLAEAERIVEVERSHPTGRAACSLDKAWAGLHFLFVRAGYDVEAEMLDVDRAPRRSDCALILLDPMTVSVLSANFHWTGREGDLARWYAPEAMQDVYPCAWGHDGADLAYLLGFVGQLRAFLAAAERQGQGAVVAVG